MAGSITTKVYTDDRGVSYAFRVDESNAEGEISDFDNQCCADLTTSLPDLPKGLSPRYVLAFAAINPQIKRRFFVGNPLGIVGATEPGATITAPYTQNPDGSPAAQLQWRITYFRGETRRIGARQGGDSGLTDGDTN